MQDSPVRFEVRFDATLTANSGRDAGSCGMATHIYTHTINKDKLVAQNLVMEAMLKPGLVN